MEVKELNSTTNPLLFNKNAAVNASVEAMGAGFANFLNQTTMAVNPELNTPRVENEVKVSDAKASEPKDKKPVRADKPEADRPLKKEVVKKNKSIEKDVAVVAVEVTKPQELAKASTDGAIAAVQAPAVDGEPVSVVEASALPAVAADDQIMVGDKKLSLADFKLDPARIASLGTIQLVDAQTGETYTTTGAELYQKMQAQGLVADGVLNLDGMSAVAKGETIDSALLTVVKEAINKNVANVETKPEVVVAGAEKSAEALAAEMVKSEASKVAAKVIVDAKAQIDELSALAGDADVKVSVNAKEEKIAYVATSDLVKDKNALQEALVMVQKADAKAADKPNQTTLAPSTSTAQPANANVATGKSGVPNFVPVADASAQAPVFSDKVTSIASKVVLGATEVGSTTLASAGTSGSEFVNNAKADSLAKANDSSFKDVYKGMSKEVVDQVKVNITKSAVKGIDKIDVSLKPEELGRIEIKMQIKDGKLQAHIIASRPETMEVLQKDMQSLERAFNDAGFQTDEGSLSFSFNEGNQAGAQQEKNSELRHFMSNMFENDNSEEVLNAENIANWSPEKGLNIRV